MALHYKCEDHVITHLSFVDGLIAFFNGDEESARGFKKVLATFARCTGLHVNNQKSQVFCAGMNNDLA